MSHFVIIFLKRLVIDSIKKILFLGLGGAGQRHARLFRQALPDADFISVRRSKKTPLLNKDFSVNQTETVAEKYRIREILDIDEAYEADPDLVVISSPSSMHFSDALKAAKKRKSIFIEKPGCVTYDEASSLATSLKGSKKSFFISFQRKFHPLFKKIVSYIDNERCGTITKIFAKVNSYVPSWHPYENFTDLYACRRDLGGGVVRTECHELDMLLTLFGYPKVIKSKFFRNPKYNLDVEDEVIISAEFAGIPTEIQLSFFEKNLKRDITIIGKKGIIYCDFMKGKISLVSKDGGALEEYSNATDNDKLFMDQLDFFLKNFNKPETIQTGSLLNLMKFIEDVEKTSC